MSSSAALSAELARLLRQAARWRLAALLLERPGQGWLEQAEALAAEAEDGELADAVRLAACAGEPPAYDSWCGPGGPAPLREAAYVDAVHLGPLLAELRAYYEAFAYRPAVAEPPDHAAVEAGFVAYARLKQAYAAAGGDRERAKLAGEAADRFTADHVRPLAAALAETCRGGPPHLAAAAAALQRLAAEQPEAPEGGEPESPEGGEPESPEGEQ